MFIVSRKENFNLQINKKTYLHKEEYSKKFLDQDFIPIINFISSKGLEIKIPSVLDSWDTNFIYKKLSEIEYNLEIPAKELLLFLYMRLNKNEPLFVIQKSFSFLI